MSNYQKKTIYLSKADYDILYANGAKTGTIIKNNITYYYDENAIYMVPSTAEITYSAGTNIQISSSNVISATDNDTKNTAGSSNTSSKLYLIGATSQSSNPVTYSNSSLYATNGSLCCLSIYNPNGTSTSGSGSVGTSSNYWSGVYTDYLYILSDERLKNKIKKIDNSKFNRVILNTPVYDFTFKNDINKTPKIGIMAQDLERELAEDYIYFGDIVDDSEKSGLKDKHQLKENKLIYLLWGALQEQQEEINILKTKISKLED